MDTEGQRVCSRVLSDTQTWLFHLTTQVGTASSASQKGKPGCWGRARSPPVMHRLVAFIASRSEAQAARLQACPEPPSTPTRPWEGASAARLLSEASCWKAVPSGAARRPLPLSLRAEQPLPASLPGESSPLCLLGSQLLVRPNLPP